MGAMARPTTRTRMTPPSGKMVRRTWETALPAAAEERAPSAELGGTGGADVEWWQQRRALVGRGGGVESWAWAMGARPLTQLTFLPATKVDEDVLRVGPHAHPLQKREPHHLRMMIYF